MDSFDELVESWTSEELDRASAGSPDAWDTLALSGGGTRQSQPKGRSTDLKVERNMEM